MSDTLLNVLKQQFPTSSRRTIMQWITWGRILVDGVVAKKANLLISNEQAIELVKKETTPKVSGLPLLYKDRYLVAIDKPTNLLSYPTDYEDPDALGLLREGLHSSTIYPVHRIDYETSGVLLFARGKESAKRLQILFTSHNLHREYYAIVEGRILQNEGVWEHYLVEKENYDVEITSSAKGKKAITYFKVLHRSKQFTYLSLRLETGRKHQIRVQCAHAGFPVIGDHRYGSTCDPIKRLGLHAYMLRLEHPFTKKELSFIAPLPFAFKKLGFHHDTLSE